MLDVCMQTICGTIDRRASCLGGAVIIFDAIYYYKQQALDCFRHSDSKKRQKVKKVRKNTGGTGESDVSSLPSLSSLSTSLVFIFFVPLFTSSYFSLSESLKHATQASF